MKKLSILLILVACLLVFCGCWDKKELEDNTFAVLLGVDKAENEDVIVTIAFPLTQAEGGGPNESTDNGSGNYSVVSVKAPTMVEGLTMFSMQLSSPLALHSVKTIVISQDIAREDMLSQIFSSWRYGEIRNTTNVLISECKAAEFIQARVKNSLIDPLRQEELLLEQANDSAYYKPIGMLELFTGLSSASGSGVAMYGGVAAKNHDDGSNQDNKQQNDNEEKSGADIKEAVKAGYFPDEVPIATTNESRISGLAVFSGAKMAGVLNSQEAQTYSMLTQSKTKKILTLQDPLAPEYNIVVEVLPDGKNKISSTINNGVPVFYIGVRLTCTVECIQSGIDYALPKNYQILTEHIQEICSKNMMNLITKIQKEYNADILKLGDKLAYHFSTAGEWEEYGWGGEYKDAEINLNVSVNIEHTGIMVP